MRATAAPEEGNKVRLSVEIDETEIAEAVDEVLRRLSRQIRVPGFRPGKVPRKVIEARLGGPVAVRTEAIRESVPDFYNQAIVDTDLDPITQPDIDITAGDDTPSGPLSFDAVVEVRPRVAIPGYAGLEVTLPSLTVTEEEVTAQVDRLRAGSGELVEVSRPAAHGDQVTIDLHGTRVGGGDGEDLDTQDFLYQVGSGGVVPELDDQLAGAKVGDILEFEASVGDEGERIAFRVLVKLIQELELPEATDEWASEASEFDTVEALRADIAERLRQRKVVEAQMALQSGTGEALAALVTEEIPEALVAAELRERLHDLSHRLEAQGMTLAQLVAATGRDEQAFLDELRAGALESVKVDLALRALVEEEGIELTDEELDEELTAMGQRLDLDPDEVRSQLEQAGRLTAVRSDRRKAKAMRWLMDNVALVDPDGTPISRDDLTIESEDPDEEDAQ
jgi:trigger factor